MEKIYKAICAAAKRHSANKVVLYGSRARGDNREKSDVDIAVFGMPKSEQILFVGDINDIPTLLKFDIVFVTDETDPALMNNIYKDGVIIMDKLSEKLNKFVEAVRRLEEALEEYDKYSISSSRDGVIQRFEFCAELSWKTTREYLLLQGYADINSPRSVMRQAYEDDLIDDDKAWLDLLYSRNLTSHIYDENTADEIFKRIGDIYLGLFKKLIDRLESR